MADSAADELSTLRAENSRLRAGVSEMQSRAKAYVAKQDKQWAARVEELERAARGFFETDEEWAVRDAAMLPPLKGKGGR